MDLIEQPPELVDVCSELSKTFFYDTPDVTLVKRIITGQNKSTPDYSMTKEEIAEMLYKDDVKSYDPDVEMHEPTQLSQCETVPTFDSLFDAFK